MNMSLSLPANCQPRNKTAQPLQWPGTPWLWPACAALVVHGLAAGILLLGWNPQAPAPLQPPASISLSLVSAAMAQPEPTPATLPAVTEAAPPAPLSEPVAKPAPVERPAPVIDQAAMAIERRQREQQRQRELEQQRLQQQRIAADAEQARQQAEQQRQQQLLAAQARAEAEALQARQQQAARLSQYQPISKIAPDYPRRALDKGIEGDCTVQYDVTPNGRVSQPTIVSCDNPLFERPSLRAAANFRYQPQMVNGQAITVPGIRNTFRFRIE